MAVSRKVVGTERSLGLVATTGIGVGAIVGGGILALAGVAFAHAGPAAMVAFALNGLIAFVTALSFAEMSAAFPESGGIYAFSKKVLSVEAAFVFGWVVWFASIVAAALYALGFAAFGGIALARLWELALGSAPAWIMDRRAGIALAAAATAAYAFGLTRRAGGVGRWANLVKLTVFGVLILGGIAALAVRPAAVTRSQLFPFFPKGGMGVFRAMGFTFIALQGFDLISAVAGEVKNPGRNIPRAMILSLAIALGIYLPFLFVTATAGMAPGSSILAESAAQPEAVIPMAARNYLGAAGYWLVIVAAVFSMLSALEANLLAASRVAFTMARDRTLPRGLAAVDSRQGTPVGAVAATVLIVFAILLAVRDVARAGAASSLIFLLTFALAHWIDILARRRGGIRGSEFQVPWFPLVPVAGSLACLSLALFQGFAVPGAGLIVFSWLVVGGSLFLLLFSRRARVVDASAEAVDPQLVRLRGRSPLVLVPIANPASAEAMVGVASALAPPEVGRVLLLSVIAAPGDLQSGEASTRIVDAQEVLRGALTASFAARLYPEALTTVASQPWEEIGRVARIHSCESLLLGLGELTETMDMPLERLMSSVDCDVVFLRARPGWRLGDVRRVLVAIAGRGDHDELRARLLGSLCRTGDRQVSFLRVLSDSSFRDSAERARKELVRLAMDELSIPADIKVVPSAHIAAEVSRHAAENDLTILGLRRLSRRRKSFGQVALRVARETSGAIIMISRRG